MARSSTDELAVRLGSRRVGSLLNLPGDRILFSFDEAYAEDIDRPILSLSFANAEGGLKRQPSTGRVAPPYFSNLLPEGRLRRYLARLNDANETRDFPLLRALGLDLPGAVVLDPVRPETDAASRDSAEPRSDAPNQRRLKFSLAGVQLKFSAVEDAAGGLTIPASGMGGDWILKLPSVHHEDIPENEFSIMSMARLVGIEVPDVRLVSISSVAGLPAEMAQDSFRGRHALAVRRFDRESDGRRIHTEDFAQVFGVRPDRKYDGYNYSHIGRVLASLSESEAVDQFARRLMLTILVGNGDMHLKNWSLVYNDPTRPALSPAYDLLSTAPMFPMTKWRCVSVVPGNGGIWGFAHLPGLRWKCVFRRKRCFVPPATRQKSFSPDGRSNPRTYRFRGRLHKRSSVS